MCEQIIEILEISNNINYNIDVLDNPKCIIYKCVQKNVNFDIVNYHPITLNIIDISEITQLYYDTYRKIGLNWIQNIITSKKKFVFLPKLIILNYKTFG